MDDQPAEILGLDPSLTGFGVAKCLLDSSEFVITHLSTIKTTPHKNIEGRYILSATERSHRVTNQERYDDIVDKLIELGLLVAGFTGLENMAFGAIGQGLTDLAELQGIIRFMLYKNKKEWVPISGSSVKKFVSGKGNTKKDMIPMHVAHKFAQQLLAFGQPLSKDNNQSDAIGICAFTHRFYRWRHSLDVLPVLTKEETKVFETLTKTEGAILNLHAGK